jgi:hypothetical protein
LALFFSVCAFLVFLFSLSFVDATLFRGSVLVPLVISFLWLWYALRRMVIVMVPLYFDVEAEIVKVKSQVIESMRNAPPES